MDKVSFEPYLFFMGNCKEAMEFYKDIFGGELMMQTYDEMPNEKSEKMKGKIMHASLSGGMADLMASDSDRAEKFGESFISLSLAGSDEEKLRDIFKKLSEGGKVISDLKKEFWGDIFGNVEDKFGVDWMINIGSKKE